MQRWLTTSLLFMCTTVACRQEEHENVLSTDGQESLQPIHFSLASDGPSHNLVALGLKNVSGTLSGGVACWGVNTPQGEVSFAGLKVRNSAQGCGLCVTSLQFQRGPTVQTFALQTAAAPLCTAPSVREFVSAFGTSRNTISAKMIQGLNPSEAISGPRSVKLSLSEALSGETANANISPLSLSLSMETAKTHREIWVVTHRWNTSPATIRRYELTGTESHSIPEKYSHTGSWYLPQSNWAGHRTYVSEAGLLVGRWKYYNGSAGDSAALYVIHEGLPQNSTVSPIWTPPANFPALSWYDSEQNNFSSRVCATSYRVGNDRFVGVAYVTGQRDAPRRMFVRIPLIPGTSRPTLNTRAATYHDAGAGLWGYSCYMDQARGSFWSAWNSLAGFQVSTLLPLDASAAPNFGFVSQLNNDMEFLSLRASEQGAYSLSGDAQGNLLNGKGPYYGFMYTYAYDPISNLVFGSTGTQSMSLTKAACFSTKPDCAMGVDHVKLDLAAAGIGKIGPMSPMNDGNIAALTRTAGEADGVNSRSALYLLRARNKDNPAQGFVAKKIDEILGDPYMYTDFTGATLYAETVERRFPLASAGGFSSSKSVRRVGLRWMSQAGTATPWQGLKLLVRCRNTTAGESGQFEEIGNVPESGKDFDIDLPQCKSRFFDEVSVRIEPQAGGTNAFSRTQSVTVSWIQ